MTTKADNQPVKVVKRQVESIDITKPDETLHLAIDLAKFIKENKLFQNIQGKEYVNVEGWQYAGSRLGIMPVVDEVTNVSVDGEMKYQAKVSLINLRNDQKVGAGFAVCSNKEAGKKFYQEFAIASMAQTRAIGKAYRNILAWIIRAAGYEPTPAEEMDYTNYEAMTEKPDSKASLKASHIEEETVKYATSKQKEEIIKLLNHPQITREEKNKMLLNINKLDEERARMAIDKLKKTIQEREDATAAA
jgi:hypothetical protein